MDFLFQIEEYLKGNLSYKEGVELYKQYGTNNTLKTLFAGEKDDYTVSKLKKELQSILENRKQIKEVSNFKVFSPSKKRATINVEALPPHLKTEYYKLSPIIREIAATNPTLIHLKNDEARYDSANRILELVEKRKAIFQRLEYFQEHGKDHPFYEPPRTEIKPAGNVSLFEAHYRLKLLLTQRSKLKKKENRVDDYMKVCSEIQAMRLIIENGE